MQGTRPLSVVHMDELDAAVTAYLLAEIGSERRTKTVPRGDDLSLEMRLNDEAEEELMADRYKRGLYRGDAGQRRFTASFYGHDERT